MINLKGEINDINEEIINLELNCKKKEALIRK